MDPVGWESLVNVPWGICSRCPASAGASGGVEGPVALTRVKNWKRLHGAELGTAEVSWVAKRVLEPSGSLLPSPKANIAVRKSVNVREGTKRHRGAGAGGRFWPCR